MILFGGKPVRTFTMDGYWGNNISWFDAQCTRVVGHVSEPPIPGDLLSVLMKSGKEALYRFTKVKRELNPPDMFFGTVAFWKYEREEFGDELL